MLRIEPITKGLIIKYLLDNIKQNDLYLGEPEENIEYGYELNPHVTIVYGYETDTIKEIHNSFNGYDKNSAVIKLGKINFFEHKMYYVLYIEVLGEDILNLNKITSNSGLKITDSYPNYCPHCTLAYIKPNAWKKYSYLVGDSYFDGMIVKCSQIKITTSNGDSAIYSLG